MKSPFGFICVFSADFTSVFVAFFDLIFEIAAPMTDLPDTARAVKAKKHTSAMARMTNFFPNLRFKKVVTIFTEVKGLPFADEAVRLGPDFMDAYEDPLIHRQNEQI